MLTGTTGRLIEEVTNLKVHKYLAGPLGGKQQLERRLRRMILMLWSESLPIQNLTTRILITWSVCATLMANLAGKSNLAITEIIILAIDRGDLDWREM